MISFAKYHCAGNDFIIFPESTAIDVKQIPNLCHRRYGIGADGIFLWKQAQDGFQFYIYNADGSEAEMCGNGLRCLAHHIAQKYGSSLTLYSKKRKHACHVDNTTVEVELGIPVWKKKDLHLDEKLPAVDIIDTGVPHAVFIGSGFDQFAEIIRNHPALQPEGVNVTCIEETCIRTFERGVEEETYACGTGAAAALAYLQQKRGIEKFVATFRRGTTLSQYFQGTSIFQSGEVHHVFQGTFLNELKR